MQSPTFESVQSACQKLLPVGIGGSSDASEMPIKHGVKLAKCIRAHDLRPFADPTTSPPSTPLGSPHRAIVEGECI